MTGYDKWTRAVTGLLFVLFIVMVAVLNILTPDRAFSESENRVLEKRPSFSLQSLLSGKFTSNYETYITAQFAFRDAWIGLKTDADRVMGKKDSNGVYLGKDGYLIQHFSSPSDAEVNDRVQAIRSIHRAAPEVRKYIMLVPTAAALHQDKLPAYAPIGDEHAALDRIRQSLQRDIRFVDVYPALHAGREEAVFYKTDHHWTSKGAYYAYRVLGKQMGIVPKEEAAFNIRQVTNAFYGSLYSKSGFRHLQPDRIELYLPKEERKKKVEYVDEGLTTDSLYQMDNLDKKDKYAVFLNGNHALVRITTDHPDGRRLLIVKDSYANSLIPFLAEHFTEIDVVDLRYYEESVTKLIQERQFHDMLFLYNIHTFFEDPSILNIME